jgi:hypothetical protein
MVRTQLFAILDVCLFILIQTKIIWFGLGGLLLVRKGLSKAARVAFSADMFLKIKTVCLFDAYQRCSAFKRDPQNISIVSRCLNTLIQKLS